MPIERAASIWPRSIDWIPARNTSAAYAPVFNAKMRMATTNVEIRIPNPNSSMKYPVISCQISGVPRKKLM